jgi:hypothetical protein
MGTYYISPTGSDTTGNGSLANPWASLYKAIAGSATTDTIVLAAGTYTAIANDKSINFGSRTILGNGIAHTIYNYASQTLSSYTCWFYPDSATIQDMTFKNMINIGTSNFPAIRLMSNKTPTFTRVCFDNCRGAVNAFIDGTQSSSGQGKCDNTTVTLISCIFLNSGTNGVIGSYAADGTISYVANNCIVVQTATGTSFGYAFTKSAGCASLIAKNCIAYNSSTTPLASANGSPTITYSCFYGTGLTLYTGTGNIASDPLFVDSVNGDYKLRPTSPCIGTGTII